MRRETVMVESGQFLSLLLQSNMGPSVEPMAVTLIAWWDVKQPTTTSFSSPHCSSAGLDLLNITSALVSALRF